MGIFSSFEFGGMGAPSRPRSGFLGARLAGVERIATTKRTCAAIETSSALSRGNDFCPFSTISNTICGFPLASNLSSPPGFSPLGRVIPDHTLWPYGLMDSGGCEEGPIF